MIFQLRMGFAAWLGVSASLQFGGGLPGCIPGGAGVGGPLLVAAVIGLGALAFGGQVCGESGSAHRAGVIAPGVGIGGLLQHVGFGLRSESQLAADVRRGGGASALTLESSCFEVAAVQAADDVSFVADLQRGKYRLPHGFKLGVATMRLEGDGLVRVGDPGGFAVGGGGARAAQVFRAQRGYSARGAGIPRAARGTRRGPGRQAGGPARALG